MRMIAARATVVVAAAAVGIALAVGACGSPTPSPGDPAAEVPAGVEPRTLELLLANDQTPTGPTETLSMAVGDTAEVPWAQYLEVSKRVGLDFSAAEGRAATLYRTPVRGREPDASAFVLVIDGQVAGAWISPGGTIAGVLAINERP